MVVPAWVDMAKGKYFSNCSGPLIIRLKRSDSTRLMHSSNPSTRSKVQALRQEEFLSLVSPLA